MTERKDIYDSLKLKMEDVGFQFEKEQKPHLQNRKETELKFIHPQLIKKLEEDGYNVNAKKYYIKPLTDELDSEIGFVTGKSSPFYTTIIFSKPNSTDSFDKTLAWTNREGDSALDNLLIQIKDYLNTPTNFSVKNTNSFLFAWNPNKWEWTDLNESIDHLENVGYVERRWSCRNSKSIKKGDRVFLIRLSEEPRGIMGSSGFAKSSFRFSAFCKASRSTSLPCSSLALSLTLCRTSLRLDVSIRRLSTAWLVEFDLIPFCSKLFTNVLIFLNSVGLFSSNHFSIKFNVDISDVLTSEEKSNPDSCANFNAASKSFASTLNTIRSAV